MKRYAVVNVGRQIIAAVTFGDKEEAWAAARTLAAKHGTPLAEWRVHEFGTGRCQS